VTQHTSLSIERWRSFTPDQRLLMIANEMQRVLASLSAEHARSRELGYERVLALTDLSIELAGRPALRRELLRWRDLVADLYAHAARGARPAEHRAALRALLLLSSAGSEEIRAPPGDLAPPEP
jgi:hypothetical protein